MMHLAFLVSILLGGAHALDNGAITKPFLGWSTWNLLGCRVNETVIREMADAMVSSGMRDAGYTHVMMDDGWTTCAERDHRYYCLNATGGRGDDGKLVADPTSFPSGIKALADYIHAKGLQFGIYTSIGALTCGGYEGSLGHEGVDAQTFADWGVDFVKHDYCNCTSPTVLARTPVMRDALNATGRVMAYYVDVGGMVPRLYGGALSPHRGSPREGRTCNRPEHLPWVWGPQTANMWKTWHDIGSATRSPSGADEGIWPLLCTWDHVMQNVDHNTDHGQILSSGPGAYNFPDMIMAGLPGCTPTEQRAQLSLWVVMGVPLVVSNDLRAHDPDTLALLTNPEALAIVQDPLALPGARVAQNGSGVIYAKALSGADPPARFAVVLLNRGQLGSDPISITLGWCHDFDPFGLCTPPTQRVRVRDVWAGKDLGAFVGGVTLGVAPHDAKLLVITAE